MCWSVILWWGLNANRACPLVFSQFLFSFHFVVGVYVSSWFYSCLVVWYLFFGIEILTALVCIKLCCLGVCRIVVVGCSAFVFPLASTLCARIWVVLIYLAVSKRKSPCNVISLCLNLSCYYFWRFSFVSLFLLDYLLVFKVSGEIACFWIFGGHL